MPLYSNDSAAAMTRSPPSPKRLKVTISTLVSGSAVAPMHPFHDSQTAGASSHSLRPEEPTAQREAALVRSYGAPDLAEPRRRHSLPIASLLSPGTHVNAPSAPCAIDVTVSPVAASASAAASNYMGSPMFGANQPLRASSKRVLDALLLSNISMQEILSVLPACDPALSTIFTAKSPNGQQRTAPRSVSTSGLALVQSPAPVKRPSAQQATTSRETSSIVPAPSTASSAVERPSVRVDSRMESNARVPALASVPTLDGRPSTQQAEPRRDTTMSAPTIPTPPAPVERSSPRQPKERRETCVRVPVSTQAFAPSKPSSAPQPEARRETDVSAPAPAQVPTLATRPSTQQPPNAHSNAKTPEPALAQPVQRPSSQQLEAPRNIETSDSTCHPPTAPVKRLSAQQPEIDVIALTARLEAQMKELGALYRGFEDRKQLENSAKRAFAMTVERDKRDQQFVLRAVQELDTQLANELRSWASECSLRRALRHAMEKV